MQAKLLEHNVRFGDPECQNLMLRLESDLLEVLLAACDGTLAQVQLHWSPHAALTVVMAAEGYPGSYKKGSVIRGLDNVTTAKVRLACRALFSSPVIGMQMTLLGGTCSPLQLLHTTTLSFVWAASLSYASHAARAAD